MSDAYLDLVMGTQALRREVEREAVDLFGALGVAAWRLPHQLANVERVLTAPRVRHLLADEVGLGKTVQALMILNALRLQSGGRLRALIVAPDALVAQWRDELLCRGHEAPQQQDLEGDDEDDQRAARLAWPGRMLASDIDPARYDLLIVDELHALPLEIQRRITRQGPLFPHVLLLTATPPFHDPARLVDLLRVLEPARVTAELVDPDPGRVLAALQAREREVAELIDSGGGDWERWQALGGAPPVETLASSAAQAHCALRGVVRARRADWPSLFPARRLHVLEVEPTEAEVERLNLLWRYFTYLGELTREFDLDLLAQRALRSPASLRQRVTYLRGHGHEREGLLAQVAPLLDREHGDSRLDALCDLLAGIWEREPAARVLVVAGDNLTADDLAARLPELLGRVGPPDARVELAPVKVRNQAKPVDSVSDEEHEIESAVSRFRRGEANLLLAAETGKVGLNLQWTRHLVLYSVPWDPQDVEQWLGRVDRIGNPALRDDDGELQPVEIYTIAWRGQVDQRVLDVIRAAGVLERSVSMDGEAVERVRDAIRAAALSDDPEGWRRVLGQARALSGGSELEEDAAPLARWLPWTADAGMRRYAARREARAVEPVIGHRRRADGFEDREQALLSWLYAAQAERAYKLGKVQAHPGLRTLGYPELAAAAGGAHVDLSALPHPQGALKDLLPTPFKKVHFLVRHGDLGSPPRRELVDAGGRPRYVHFLDHGSHLHEELVKTWLHCAANTHELFTVHLPAAHPAGALRGRWLRLLVGSWSPGDLLPPPPDDADPLLVAAHMADQRLLGLHVAARLLVHGELVARTGCEAAPRELVLALLRPQATEGSPWARCDRPTVPDWLTRAQIDEVDRVLHERAAAELSSALTEAWSALSAALEERRYLLATEARALRQLQARALAPEARAMVARELEAIQVRLGWLQGLSAVERERFGIKALRSVLIQIR